MTAYKGIEIAPGLRPLLRHMESVDEYREMLQRLQAVWDNLALLGQLSGMATDMGSTRQAFADLTTSLLNNLGLETRRKVVQEMRARAQVAVDILTRNLFERTADIGFLATDDDLRRHAAGGEHAPSRAAIVARFRDYVRKYSVYDDIVLLAPDGEVLARLDERCPVERSGDPLIAEALATPAAYLEHFRPSDLYPGRGPVLLYAYRVTAEDGTPLAVLCLSFRFDNEMARIFANLRRAGDWHVIALLDAEGRVLASSDQQQLPLAARVETVLDADCRVVRHGGRQYLAATRPTAGYQGYSGPGWLGHVMVPLEHAFTDDGADRLSSVPPALVAGVMRSPTLFSAEMRSIPEHADRIQQELNRSVWNGSVQQSRAQGSLNTGFSKVLLGEIGHTGLQTRDVFERSIGNLHQTVVSAILGDSEFLAALAIDIMDRNLYERANDCRWWALTTAFRELLAGDPHGEASRQRIGAILAGINALYTVYDNLVVFDRHGRVVAVSNPAHAGQVGSSLGDEWVRRTLALDDSQQYAVSAFEPTPLYAGRHTYIYAAPIFSPDGAGVGGIGIVFDAAPQFDAMLQDALPRDTQGQPLAGSFAVFAERGRRVIASTLPGLTAGELLPVAAEFLVDGGSGIVSHQGAYYAVGSRLSTGYREYKGAEDAYRNEVFALVFIPLGQVMADSAAAPAGRLRASARRALEPGLATTEIATFHIGDEWLGLLCSEVLEAVDASGITPVPGMPPAVRGVLMYQGNPVPVFDLKHELRFGRGVDENGYRQVVIVRAGESSGRDNDTGHGAPFGILAHGLAETLEVASQHVEPISTLFPGHAALAESVVRPDPGQGRDGILVVLSSRRLRNRLARSVELPERLPPALSGEPPLLRPVLSEAGSAG